MEHPSKGRTGNKIRSYFIYAIGEVALVMIGILLALQVNNWNEERKQDRNTEILIGAIHDEFVTVRRELNSVIERKEIMINRVNAILDNMGRQAPSFPRNEVNEQLRSITNNLTADLGNPVLINALNSESIYWIDDAELKTLLTGWEAEKNDLLSETENYIAINTRNILDLLTDNYEMPVGFIVDTELDNQSFDMDHNLIYTNLRLKNLLVLKKNIIELAIRENTVLLELCEQIIEKTQ